MNVAICQKIYKSEWEQKIKCVKKLRSLATRCRELSISLYFENQANFFGCLRSRQMDGQCLKYLLDVEQINLENVFRAD